jgi:hypothetical protein
MAQKFNFQDFTGATTDIAASLLNYDETKTNLFNITQTAGKIYNDFLKIIDPTSSGLPGILTGNVHVSYSGGYLWFIPQSATNRFYRYHIATEVWGAIDTTNALKGTGTYKDAVIVADNSAPGTWDIFTPFNATAPTTEAGILWVRGVPDSMFSIIGTVPAAAAVTDGRTTATTTGACFIIKDNNSAVNTLISYSGVDAESKVAGNIQLVLLDTTRRAQVSYIDSTDMTVAGALPRVSNTVTPAVTTGISVTVAAPITQTQISKCVIGGTAYYVYGTATQLCRFLFSDLTAGNVNWLTAPNTFLPALTIPGSGNAPLPYNSIWGTPQRVCDLGTVDGVGDERLIYIFNGVTNPMIMGRFMATGIAYDMLLGQITNQTDRVSDQALPQWQNVYGHGLILGCAHDSVGKRLFLQRSSSSGLSNVASQQVSMIDYSHHNAYVILPKIVLPGATSLGRVLRNGTFANRNQTKIYYRTSGISTNLGAWTAVDNEGDLTGVVVPVGGEIQFKIEFPVWDLPLATQELTEFIFTWFTRSIEPQFCWYQPTTDGRVYWIQQETFGGPVPGLTIAYYVNPTNSLVFEQASSGSLNGVFEYFNGVAWVTGLGPDVLYTIRRFTPSVAIGTMDIRAELRFT